MQLTEQFHLLEMNIEGWISIETDQTKAKDVIEKIREAMIEAGMRADWSNIALGDIQLTDAEDGTLIDGDPDDWQKEKL